jgi:hypothetical protein
MFSPLASTRLAITFPACQGLLDGSSPKVRFQCFRKRIERPENCHVFFQILYAHPDPIAVDRYPCRSCSAFRTPWVKFDEFKRNVIRHFNALPTCKAILSNSTVKQSLTDQLSKFFGVFVPLAILLPPTKWWPRVQSAAVIVMFLPRYSTMSS